MQQSNGHTLPGGKLLKTALKVAVGLGLLCFLAQRVEMRRVFSLIAQVSLPPLALALAVKVCGILSQVSRWQLLLQSRGVTLERLTLLRITLASRFINLFLPGQIGGDLYRVMGVHKHSAGLLQSTGIVLMERYLSLVATLLMAGAAIVASGFTATQPALSYLVLAMLAAAACATFPATNSGMVRLALAGLRRVGAPPSWEEHLARAHDALTDIVSRPWLLIKFVFFCLVMNSATILQMYLLGGALGFTVPLSQLAFFMPLYNIACAIPISINSLGVREASMVAFFSHMGLPPDKVTGLAFLLLIWLYLTDAPNGIFILFGPPGRQAQPEKQ